MKVAYLTSAFSSGFTDDFIESLKKYYIEVGEFVFVASSFEEHAKNDKYTECFVNLFKDVHINFSGVNVVDSRLTQHEAKEVIKGASIVFLSGGDTLKQIGYLNEYDLVSSIRERDGITIGMSAGSINMAEKVVLAKDESDNIPELSIYDGIGLVHLNIEPHINNMSNDHLAEVEEASKVTTIVGLPDDSFILVTEDQVVYYGDYRIF